VTGFPSALVEALIRFFGAGALPDYAGSIEVIGRDPYRPLRLRLAALVNVEDLTDLHYDLGWSWWFSRCSGPVNLRLSFVGPYATLLDSCGNEVVDDEVLDLVRSEGFTVCSIDLLSLPVSIWEPEVQGSVYEFLFEFDNGTPWD
jgi:hypothetical protein